MPTLTEIQKEVAWRFTEQKDLDHVMNFINEECFELTKMVKKYTRAEFDPKFIKINGKTQSEYIEEMKKEGPDLIFAIAELFNLIKANLDDCWNAKMEYNNQKYNVVGYPE